MGDTFVHFEIPADDPERLMDFYSNVFKWQFQRTPMPGSSGAEYVLIQTTEPEKPGMNGGMYKRGDATDKPRNYIGVESIDATLTQVVAQGGTVMQPKMEIPGIGWAAFIADPEGNPLGLFEGQQLSAEPPAGAM